MVNGVMEERIIISIAYCGVFSILLQIVGIFSPAWMVYSFEKSHGFDWKSVHLPANINTTEPVIWSAENRSIIVSTTFNTTTGQVPRNLFRNGTPIYNFTASANVNNSYGFVVENITLGNDGEFLNATEASRGDEDVTTDSLAIKPGTKDISNDSNKDAIDSSKGAFASVINNTNGNDSENGSAVSFMTRLDVRMGLWSRSACLYWSDSVYTEAFVEDCKTEPTLKLDKILSAIAFSTNTTGWFK